MTEVGHESDASGQSTVPVSSDSTTVALVGNPNTGKTTLFNRLTGLRARTANFPGITVDLRRGRVTLCSGPTDVVDFPGLYSLNAVSPEEQVTANALAGKLASTPVPDAVVLVLDATNIERNLVLASEVLDLRLPTVVALNQFDAARAADIRIDVSKLSHDLKCRVVPVSARTGEGLNTLRAAVDETLSGTLPIVAQDHQSCTVGCTGCTFAARFDWAESVSNANVEVPPTQGRRTDAIDGILTRPIVGFVAFLSVMLAVFYLIFSLASIPMDMVDIAFGALGAYAERFIPQGPVSPGLWFGAVFCLAMSLFAAGYAAAGISWSRTSGVVAIAVAAVVSLLPVEDFRSLLVDGVIGGVGGVVIFLPQICILFFFISLLEDSGYMARAAFVMERLMQFVGLPGKAFVPMLSAHACAIPGIMAARVIENWRDRLVTILVLPLLTCSARLPVYTMIAALLFSGSPFNAALVFVGAYVLGIAAALFSAWCLKKTILRGDPIPLVIELPAYRVPSLRNAFATVIDRGTVFVRQAGTVILLISVILWALATYPKLPVSDTAQAASEQSTAKESVAQEALAYSFAGRAGQLFEPVFRPLGFDWKINVGVITSFAAREVVVSTLAIVYGIGEDSAEDEATLVETLRRQKRPDGSPVFTKATGFSLLVFFVLAMQCLPTQAVTKRETGSWKWAVFQLVYMSAMAYVAALVTFQSCTALGI
ncbi:MAG: ferrous iron transporter B [Fuerstiella sp.]|nr:ferrous iron transporter B [Fuerstiella sp.]